MAASKDAAGEALAGGADVDRRLREAADVLDMIARRVGRRLGGHIELDDLKAHGHEALLQIVTAYDPARASFRAYAALKLKWAIYDGLRQTTHGRAGNRMRALMASERVAASWAADLGKGPEPGDEREPPREPNNEADYEERLRSMLETQAAALAVGLLVGPEDHDALVDEATSPEDRVVNNQSRAALRGAVAALPERERTLIQRHYFDDDRFDRIAVDLGISKSRASRLHARAILRLARALQEHGE